MRWVRIFEDSNPEMAQFMKKEKSPIPSEDSAAITALLLENERLRTELKHEKLRAHAYDTMIDVAEEMFNIPIRKSRHQTMKGFVKRVAALPSLLFASCLVLQSKPFISM